MNIWVEEDVRGGVEGDKDDRGEKCKIRNVGTALGVLMKRNGIMKGGVVRKYEGIIKRFFINEQYGLRCDIAKRRTGET